MPKPVRTDQQYFIQELEQYPEKGHVAIVRITNKRAVQLDFLMEPLGDEGEPLSPGASYDVVTQAHGGDYVLDIDIEDDCIRVWFISSTVPYGKAFNREASITGY